MARLFNTYTPVYYWNRDSKKRIKINQGGSSSSKTISILQLICKKLIENPGWIATVAAETTKSLQKGALRDFKRLLYLSPLLRHSILDPTLKEGPYVFRNGSILEFDSIKDAGEARHGKREILFINEINYVDYESVTQMLSRSEDVYFDFNSDSRFWIHKEFLKRPDVDYFISNFTHNPYAKQPMIDEILNYKALYLETGKKYWQNKWRVYGLGLTGATSGAVFDKVDIIKYLPVALRKRSYCLDFGFTVHPTALALIGEMGETIYGKELLYEKKLDTPDLIKKLPSLGITKNDLIICDNNNGDALTQIQKAGYNAIPCDKGGGVEARLKALSERKIVLTQDSLNWWEEQENYKFKMDGAEPTEEPIDEHNHLWDCLGYWYTHHYPQEVRKFRKSKRQLKVI
jgi:phage terminase large subunit